MYDRTLDTGIREAVKELRSHIGLTQTEFAGAAGASIATIQRHETLAAPHGKALAVYLRMAEAKGRPDLEAIFRNALCSEMGMDLAADSLRMEWARGALRRAACFIAEELIVQERSFLPNPTDSEAASIKNTKSVLDEVSLGAGRTGQGAKVMTSSYRRHIDLLCGACGAGRDLVFRLGAE